MAKGKYEIKSADGSMIRFTREPDDTVTFRWDGYVRITIPSLRWREITDAMALEPLRHDDIPIVGEIIGWRCWRVDGDGLWSLHRRQMWLPNTTETGHVGEDVGGIYAFKSRSRAHSEANDPKWDRPIAVGSVSLWGDAIEAANGWRAEYAKLLTLDAVYVWPEPKLTKWQMLGTLFGRWPVPPNGGEILRALRRRYGVEERDNA